MNTVARFFLRANHWQIFLLLFLIFLVGDVALLASISTTVQSKEVFGKADILYGTIMVLFFLCFAGWFWSMGSFLSSIAHPALRLRIGFFRFALIFPLVYLPVFMAFFLSIGTHPALVAVILPLHFFAMYCMFYLLYFVSKSLVLAESGKPATFYDYSGPFFLLWFFPIGVWVIQPRINRLYKEHGHPEPAIGNGVA